MPHRTRGFRGVLRNMAYARREAAQVNHVFGDIHYIACALPTNRTLLTVADCTTLVHRAGIRRSAIQRLWYTWPIARSAAITTISESTRQELLRLTGCPPVKVRVVHVPVSPGFVVTPSAFDPSCPKVLQVGTKPNKNLERVARALEGIPCTLRIVGPLSGAQHAVLDRAGIRYTAVAGISDAQLVQEYRDCDMLVFASTYEGFGLPVVEAQATGRPVVTSNLCSMPEVAGGAACLVDPYDVQDMRRGILRVINDQAHREELVCQGLLNVKRFRPAAIAAQYASIYHELASGQGSR